jgi:hypothetical protein
MARVITITNVSGQERTYGGQTIADTETYIVANETERQALKLDSSLFGAVSTGAVLIGDGTSTFSDPVKGWEWLQGAITEVLITQNTPALGNKVAVHSSPKPELEGTETFVVWTGAGDDPNATDGCGLGEGDLLNFLMTIGIPEVTKDVIWNQAAFGRVWIHEAYLKFTNGGNGDYITAYVMSKPSNILDAATVAALEGAGQLPLGAVSLDLVQHEEDETRFKMAPDGPGTGTHGFGGTPVLVPHTFTKNGDWDFDGTNLLPNLTGTGSFTIHNVEKICHKYVNKVPCFGTCATYFMMSSDETAEIRDGYFARITCYNKSNTNWQASVLMEIYREQTVSHECDG